MPFDLAKINVWAVLVAGLIAFLVGGVWYTALFGKRWVRLQGFTPEQVKEMQAKMSPPLFFGGMLVSYFVLAVALAAVLTAFSAPTMTSGAALGVAFWLGVAGIYRTNHIASGKPLGVYLIDVGCDLVYLVLMGALLGAWR
jgi:hypothetical protein